MHPGEDRVIARTEPILLIGFAAAHGRDVVRGVDGFEQCKINIGRWHDPKSILHPELAGQRNGVGDPTGRHRMMGTEVVLGQIVGEDEQSTAHPLPPRVPCLFSRAAAASSRLRSRAASMATRKAARTL